VGLRRIQAVACGVNDTPKVNEYSVHKGIICKMLVCRRDFKLDNGEDLLSMSTFRVKLSTHCKNFSVSGRYDG
jgi:hypothetical protein